MEKSTGTVDSVVLASSAGIVKEDNTGLEYEFVNPRIPDVAQGQRYEFLKIIQSTPNGDKVTAILTKRLP